MAQNQEKTQEKYDKMEDKSRVMVVLPYVKGLTDKVARILKKRGVSTVMKHTPH